MDSNRIVHILLFISIIVLAIFVIGNCMRIRKIENQLKGFKDLYGEEKESGWQGFPFTLPA